MAERDRDRDRDIPIRERDIRERDIPVAPLEYAYVQDLTKGDVNLYVGPCKISLTNTERMVDFYQGRFRPLRGDDGSSGVNPFILASSSQYIILENPAKDSHAKYSKGNNSPIELVPGKKVVVAGPAAFALWPGQKAQVINGHTLREDQYLVVRVYDTVESEQGEKTPIGTEHIVKGTDVNFYIPKTGLEVVPENGQYVRNAVTLLDGQYCILLAPNGQRKYFRGPAVVFPEPMEQFVEQGGTRVFKAFNLRKNLGLHIRVLKDVTISGGEQNQVPPGTYTAGQEIFLKDREGFFFPTEHFEVVASVQAIPLADKEGIYVRDIETGKMTTEVGPKNYLPDPTRVEVVSRPLDAEIVRRYGLTNHDPGKAVSIYIRPSVAVQVIAKNKRDVVRGPVTRILDYDEDLEVLRLSTGKPKTDEKLLSTCFLQIDGNKVSDIVRVKTSDHVEVQLLLSYRVSFLEAEYAKWFNVKNYVGLLCDHLASIVRSAVRGTSIDAFHANSIDVIRSAILGAKQGEEKRAGRRFAENGMLVYDVEVLDVNILDADVKLLLAGAQRAAIEAGVKKEEEELRLSGEKLRESVNQQLSEARKATLEKEAELEGAVRALEEVKASAEVYLDKLRKTGLAQNDAEALGIAAGAEHARDAKALELTVSELQQRVAAFKEQMAALQPELVATLRLLGNQHLTAELTKNLSPLAILGGDSVAAVTERLLRSLPIGLNGDGLKGLLSPARAGSDGHG